MIIISPAKKINPNKTRLDLTNSFPVFENKTNTIVEKFKKLSSLDIQSLMNVSNKISDLNFTRFQNFSFDGKSKNLNHAGFMFSGDTFIGLNIESFNVDQINYAQENLRILSGLYGLLKPLDMIQPYRLEMGTNTTKLISKSLYDYWSMDITEQLNKELKSIRSDYLFNLSSQEYFKCINQKNLSLKIVTPYFNIKKNNNITSAGMLSKKCRGAMARFIIKNRIKNIHDLKDFNEYDFSFDSIDLDKNEIFFIKNK